MPVPRIVKLMGALIVGLAFASLLPLKAFSAPAPMASVEAGVPAR